MDALLPYLGDLHKVLSPPWSGTILVLMATICGLIVGLERESKNKPAGLRTVALICVGSAIFTLASILIASGSPADRGRIAAQVVTGVGFLGAGAIIRDHGTVVGLTTGATIWTVAAIGVLIGSGYAAGGFALSIMVVAMLLGVRRFERRALRFCQYETCRLIYTAGNDKTRLKVLQTLDEHRVPDHAWRIVQDDKSEVIEIDCCTVHREHRAFLFAFTKLAEINEIQQPFVPRHTSDAGGQQSSPQ